MIFLKRVALKAPLPRDAHHHPVGHGLEVLQGRTRLRSLRRKWTMAGQTGSVRRMVRRRRNRVRRGSMAGRALVFPMANHAAAAVELGLNPVGFSPPEIGVIFRFHHGMAGRASLFFMAEQTLFAITKHTQASVLGFPTGVMAGGRDGAADLQMTHFAIGRDSRLPVEL